MDRTRALAAVWFYQQFALGLVDTLFKMDKIFASVTVGCDIHIFGGALCGAGTKSVKTQRYTVVAAVHVLHFAAGIKLTVYEIPVIALFALVVVEGHTSAEVLYLIGAVKITGNIDKAAVALSGFVNRVGKYLKKSVLAALYIVRAKDNAGAFSDPVGTFQHGNTVIAVAVVFCHNILLFGKYTPHYIITEKYTDVK